VTLNAGNLIANSRNDISGISARVYKNGVYGFSSMAEFSDEAVKAVLKASTENAVFMDSHIKKNKGMLPSISNGHIGLENDISDMEQKYYIDFIKEIDEYIAAKYKGLSSRMVVAYADSMEKLLCTSDGFSSHSNMPRSYIYLILNSETASGVPVELFKVLGDYGTFDENFKDPKLAFPEVDKLYEKLMQKKEGVYAQAGLKTCILGGDLSGMLAHEAVGHTVEADLVLGGSVAAHNLGKTVASDKVSQVDFAHTAYGKRAPLPIYVDDEGTPAEDAVIIKDGILVGYMNSRETAQHFNMKPQGNARAYLFSDEPLIRMRNTAVLPGKEKLEDIIASVEDGYYLVDTNNGQADTTGEFMFGISMGYEIKGGRLGKAILDTTISGVAFEMLKTVDMVSDRMNWASSGFCGKKQPMPVGMGGPELRCKVMIGGR
jgi:TldD protein